jgi:hypothetical protein
MNEFISAIEISLRRMRDPVIDPFLALWPARPWRRRGTIASSLPVLQWLDAAIANSAPEFKEITKYLSLLGSSLAWSQTYSAAEAKTAFLNRYGWTELIGLRGPVASEKLAVGFLLLGPEIEYPAHCHVAEEVYVPLSGAAQWQGGDGVWREQLAGARMRHASCESHAMRTAEAPLLALYLWREGDLAQKSQFVKR